MRKGFTFLELIFVIIVIAILAGFGTNLMMTTYTSYTASTINNRMQGDIELTLNQLSNRLENRIKASVIGRPQGGGPAAPLVNAIAPGVIEWIGFDVDGLLGSAVNTNPTWSGFIDVTDPNAIASSQGAAAAPYLESPGTSTGLINTTITSLRANGSGTTIANAGIIFEGAESDTLLDYGWSGALNFNVISAVHPINAFAGQPQRFLDGTVLPVGAFPPEQAILPAGNPSSYQNTDVYERYRLVWTAYAISREDFNNDGNLDLVLYYDYQPWQGETYQNNGARVLLLLNVSSMEVSADGDSFRLQICTTENNVLANAAGGYSLCQDKFIF